ncbi:tetratricopeptide repeat protein [Oceanibium sediminis]|uniref:tetratricopeptide repeat protein n=1 Tax=Oceanibium sediminis TaxID=2026339 RepID=UPI000DD4BCEC|nr:tetratricopeptide repeat protein [Oceanibium sediminis]
MAGTTDFSGCETSLPVTAIEAWNATIRGFLAHAAATPDHLAATLSAAPDFAQGHAVKGLFCMLLGRAEMTQTARDCANAATLAAAKSPPTPREQVYLDALHDYLAGFPSQAASRFEELLLSAPRDALAMKMVQAIRFVLGQPQAMRASLELVMPAWGDHPALGYLKGCHAFALEETGDTEAAERSGREGLLLAPDDAWGLHAVAHVYDMTARAEDGLFWLSGQTGAWEHCNNFRYHVWWHIALMHLDLGQIEEVFALYDREIRADKTDDYRDISNAASLLSRLEVEGISVGHRWEELADLAERRSGDGSVVFADLHYLLALVGGGRVSATKAMVQRMSQDAARYQTEMQRITDHPGMSAANGLEAYGEGRYAEAFLNLNAARADMQLIGGSHAQRDVFERLTVEAALRGGFLDAAEALLRDRTRNRGGAEDGYSARRMAFIAATREDTAPPKLSGTHAGL